MACYVDRALLERSVIIETTGHVAIPYRSSLSTKVLKDEFTKERPELEAVLLGLVNASTLVPS